MNWFSSLITRNGWQASVVNIWPLSTFGLQPNTGLYVVITLCHNTGYLLLNMHASELFYGAYDIVRSSFMLFVYSFPTVSLARWLTVPPSPSQWCSWYQWKQKNTTEQEPCAWFGYALCNYSGIVLWQDRYSSKYTRQPMVPTSRCSIRCPSRLQNQAYALTHCHALCIVSYWSI